MITTVEELISTLAKYPKNMRYIPTLLLKILRVNLLQNIRELLKKKGQLKRKERNFIVEGIKKKWIEREKLLLQVGGKVTIIQAIDHKNNKIGGNKNVFNKRKLVLLAASDCRTIHRHQERRGIYVQDHQWRMYLYYIKCKLKYQKMNN